MPKVGRHRSPMSVIRRAARRAVRRRPDAAKPRQPKPADLGDMSDWVSPPLSDGHDILTEILYDTGASAPRFDIDLFEQLNAEYADKPIVPKPTSYAVVDRIETAKKRIGWAHRS
ncbi:MAG: hypothetical protein ABIN55_05015, partial [Aeromicrobium sp.]